MPLEGLYLPETIKHWEVIPFASRIRNSIRSNIKFFATYMIQSFRKNTTMARKILGRRQCSCSLQIGIISSILNTANICKATKQSFRKGLVSGLGLNWKKLKKLLEEVGIEDATWRIDQRNTAFRIALTENGMSWEEQKALLETLKHLSYIEPADVSGYRLPMSVRETERVHRRS